MSPDQAIAALDRALATAGQDIGLQVVTGGVAGSSVTCRARVRGYRPDELVGAIMQGDSEIILSPTGLVSVPVRNGRVVVEGATRNIEAVNPIRLAGVLVRIELRARG